MKQQYIHVALIGCALFVSAALLFVPRSTQATQTVDTEMRLAPLQPSVDAGKTIRFVGTGFYRHEMVDIWATDPTDAVIRGEQYFKADGEGEVELEFQLPDRALDGTWKLTAMGKESITPVWTSFEVHGRPIGSASAPAHASPPHGAPGTTFTFTATGFDREEKISYWVTGPDGDIYFAAPNSEETNRHGQLEFDWTAPIDAVYGRWVMTMHETDEPKAHAIPFYIGDQTVVETPTPQPASQQPSSTSIPDSTQIALPTYESLPGASPDTSEHSQQPTMQPSPGVTTLPTYESLVWN